MRAPGKTLVTFPALLILLVSSTMLSACKRELAPIRYGTDAGSYCRMTIVEPRFAGSILTEKGRTLKFDAIECMTNYVLQEEQNGVSFSPDQIYASVDQQGELSPVADAFFIISDSVRTPMGGGIVAFKTDQPNSVSWMDLLDLYRRKGGTGMRP